MKIIAVVVTHNHAESILECLSSVSGQVDMILVIDSASSDNTVSLIKSHFPHITLDLSKQNFGYAKSNNLGIEKALKIGADYVFILNPDTVIDKKCIRSLLFQAETHVTPRLLGPKIYKVGYHASSQSKIIWSVGGALDKKRWTAKLIGYSEVDSGQYDHLRQVDFISGTCMFIPRKVFESGLRFLESYFMYYEDVELCVGAQKLGFLSHVVSEATIVHYETSSKMVSKNYYLSRNHLLFVERNAPIHVKLGEFLRLPISVWEHYKKRDIEAIRGTRDYLLRKFSAKTTQT